MNNSFLPDKQGFDQYTVRCGVALNTQRPRLSLALFQKCNPI